MVGLFFIEKDEADFYDRSIIFYNGDDVSYDIYLSDELEYEEYKPQPGSFKGVRIAGDLGVW